LARSKKAINEHRYGEALEGLTEILRNSEDFLTQPGGKGSIYRGLKSEVQQLLGQMPREGRQLYEVRSGAEAREKLDRAIASGSETALSEVAGQFFHTQAGYEATYLLALHFMDHGLPLAGALNLRRLRDVGPAADAFEPGLSLTEAACFYQAGMPQQCQQVLIELKRRLGKTSLPIGGREVPWFQQESEAADWLAKLARLRRTNSAVEADQWSMFRGDPSRSAATVGSTPLLNLRWRVEVAEEKTLQDGLRQQETEYRQKGFNVLSGLQPLAVGDFVLMRTAKKLLGIDFSTGKRVWEPLVPDEEQIEVQQNNFGFNPYGNRNLSQSALYGIRIWDDATYGTMSSDGNLVFVVEQLSLGLPTLYNGPMFGANGRGVRGANNALRAYEITTGKVIWQKGGGEDWNAVDGLQDAFFLGAPLPLRGQLYVIAEIKDEIRLLCLDPANRGKLLWSQQLAMVEQGVMQDPVRRLAGVSPSYADGILICPTGSGCVVALDLATRSLLWGYVYSQGDQQNMRRYRGGNPNLTYAFATYQGPPPRWLDGTAVIVNGRVLLTPAESDTLYCLNLADGKPCWDPKPRTDQSADWYYIACVHQGKIVRVGRAAMDAINLDDGKPAWEGRSVSFAPGNVTGHGFYAGNRYFVPLSTAEVAAVDLDSGKIAATAKSRKGAVPGNLVCYRGRIISQGLDGVEVYYQTDAARAESKRLLAKDSNDVEGLTLRGEIALDEGRSTDAVADFRRAYLADAGTDRQLRTRELLRDALLSGLRDNFSAHRSLAGELEKLLEDPAQWAAYYRYMATGLQRAGQWQQAIDFCFKLVDMDDHKRVLENVDRAYLVRRDRWVQARLGLIRSEGGATAAAAIDKALKPRLEEATMDTGVEGLERFIGFFDGQPQAAVARTELLERRVQAENILGAELLLASAVDGADRKAQAGLLADMAALNLRANRTADAAACYRQLASQYSTVSLHGSLTPAAWLAALPGGDALRKELNRAPDDWPKGAVDVTRGEMPATGPYYYNRAWRYDVPSGGSIDPYFSDYTIYCSSNQEIAFRDGWGRTLQPHAVRLVENGRAIGGNSAATGARSCGHLLLVYVGSKIYAIDPWRATGNSNQILWSQDMNDSSGDNAVNGVFMGGVVWGPVGIINGSGSHVNPFGPVNARVVCFQRMRNLVAVDPLSGEQLWVRQDVPPNSDVFGDEQYVFVRSPDVSGNGRHEHRKARASVYRALDGEYLGQRELPLGDPAESVNIAYNPYEVYSREGSLALTGTLYVGRNVLTWRKGPDGKRVLSLFDPWRQQPIWSERTFAAASRVDMVQQQAVGVLEPGGHFVLVDLADGHSIADVQLKARSGMTVTNLVVMRMGDQYIVLVQDRSAGINNGNEMAQPPQGSLSSSARHARVYALDLQGKLAWPEPADVDQESFLVTQPTRLPVLVFCSFNRELNGNQNRVRTALVAVDRRDGCIVCDKNDTGPMSQMGVMSLEIEGDPGDKTVRMRSSTENVVLNFTDRPAGPAVRKASGAKKVQTGLGGALLNAVQRAAGLPELP
jgi:outer membrane protein assembly factor BamB